MKPVLQRPPAFASHGMLGCARARPGMRGYQNSLATEGEIYYDICTE